MDENEYYEEYYDEYQDDYIYLQDEAGVTFVGALQQMIFAGLVSYSISVMFSHIMFGKR